MNRAVHDAAQPTPSERTICPVQPTRWVQSSSAVHHVESRENGCVPHARLPRRQPREPYVASKWAVRGLTQTAALELGRDHIRVNTIHPGVIATPFIHEPAVGATAAIADFYSPEPFAIPRLGEPTDVTRLLLFLTSSDASFITGSEYIIDGGLLLGPALQAETA